MNTHSDMKVYERDLVQGVSGSDVQLRLKCAIRNR
jgi:hypothetical protein